MWKVKKVTVRVGAELENYFLTNTFENVVNDQKLAPEYNISDINAIMFTIYNIYEQYTLYFIY